MKKLLIAAGLIAVCTAAPAFARDMDDSDMMQKKASMMTNYALAKKDMNHDGYVSKAEADAYEDKMFSKADTNGDGRLSGQEIMDAKSEELADMKDYAHMHMKKGDMPMHDDHDMPMRDDRDMAR